MSDIELARRIDEVEALRRERRLDDGLQILNHVLEQRPDHPRAVLLRGRLLYELGSFARAVDALRRVGRNEFEPLILGLKRLEEAKQSVPSPAFATESMAKLLTQQGYVLEALEVYRRLLEAAESEIRFYDEIVRLRNIVESEGSREAGRERIERELRTWDQWLERHPRET